MLNLIDAALEATTSSSAPVVVGVQNDVTAINFVAGLSDPGEMVRCGYLPQLRRMDGEQDAEYAARIRPLVMALSQSDRDRIMGAAIKRAGLDTTTGKVAVMVAGQPAWHGLGVNVAEVVSSMEAIKLASLDWSVSVKPLGWQDETGIWRDSDSAYGIVRNDTLGYLGTVGSRYEPIQNAEGFAFLDSIIGEFGAKFQTAGSVHGGKRVWMLVDLPRQAFKVHGKDEVKAYALFTNSHDGLTAARCLATSERVVCANTLRVSMNGNKEGLSIRHTGNLKAKMESARQALGLTVRAYEGFQEEANTLAATPLLDAEGYVDGVLDCVLDITAADMQKGADVLAASLVVTTAERELKAKQLQRQMDRRQAIIDDIMCRYEGERCGTNGMRGTAWAGLNAVTEYADHSELVRYKGTTEARASRRFESVLTGDGDELKQVAYAQAIALAN